MNNSVAALPKAGWLRQTVVVAAILMMCVLLARSSTRATSHAANDAIRPYEFPQVNLMACFRPVVWPLETAGVTWGAATGIAVDNQDRVWVCTTGTPPVLIFDKAGQLLNSWGDRYLYGAHQLRLDEDGNVWVVDTYDHTVQKFTEEGERLLIIGTPGISGCDESHFDEPTDVAITSDGDIFISDGYRNGRVVHFLADGQYVDSWGTKGIAAGELELAPFDRGRLARPTARSRKGQRTNPGF